MIIIFIVDISKWHLDGGDYFGIGKMSEGGTKSMICAVIFEELTLQKRIKNPENQIYEDVEDFTYAIKVKQPDFGKYVREDFSWCS